MTDGGLGINGSMGSSFPRSPLVGLCCPFWQANQPHSLPEPHFRGGKPRELASHQMYPEPDPPAPPWDEGVVGGIREIALPVKSVRTKFSGGIPKLGPPGGIHRPTGPGVGAGPGLLNPGTWPPRQTLGNAWWPGHKTKRPLGPMNTNFLFHSFEGRGKGPMWGAPFPPEKYPPKDPLQLNMGPDRALFSWSRPRLKIRSQSRRALPRVFRRPGRRLPVGAFCFL